MTVCFLLFLGVIPLCCSNLQTLHQEFWDHHHLHSTLEDLLLGPEVTSTGTYLHQTYFLARFSVLKQQRKMLFSALELKYFGQVGTKDWY